MIGELTPIEKHGELYFKRDDMFNVCGVKGGKARSAFYIIRNALIKEFPSCSPTFVTAGSRMSPQCEIVSTICESFGVECHLFMPNGKETSVTKNISKNKFSVIHRTKVGYNSVLLHDATNFAKDNGYVYIPFGMECVDNIETTKHQVRNIPKEVKRIVVPCGSGMSMISIIKGLEYYKMFDVEVLGIIVGKDPQKTFKRFLPNDLFSNTRIKYLFEQSELKYEQSPKITNICGIELDPIYESKCIPFLKENDLLWIVGHRL